MSHKSIGVTKQTSTKIHTYVHVSVLWESAQHWLPSWRDSDVDVRQLTKASEFSVYSEVRFLETGWFQRVASLLTLGSRVFQNDNQLMGSAPVHWGQGFPLVYSITWTEAPVASGLGCVHVSPTYSSQLHPMTTSEFGAETGWTQAPSLFSSLEDSSILDNWLPLQEAHGHTPFSHGKWQRILLHTDTSYHRSHCESWDLSCGQ